MLNELKAISRVEQHEIYKIIKDSGIEYSENHNGVFFDVCKLPAELYTRIREFLNFCIKNHEDFAARDCAERLAQEALTS